MKFDLRATIYDIFGYLMPGMLLLYYIIFKFVDRKTIAEIKGIGINIELEKIVIFLVLSYFFGHAISIMAEFLIEKNLYYKLRFNPEKTLPIHVYDSFKKKFKEIFGCDLSRKLEEKDMRYLVAYIEKNEENIYSTAFVFLTFYGLGRNLVLISFIVLVTSCCNVYLLLISAIAITVFFLQFIIFRNYFEHHIFSGFIIETKE